MNNIVANTTAQMGQLDDARDERGTDPRGSMQDFGDYDDGQVDRAKLKLAR